MKHPKYRVADILKMDKTVRDELFDFVWDAVKKHLPKDIVDVWMVGSYTFGNATLCSDFDFNFVCKDKKTQGDVKQKWTKEKRQSFSRALTQWWKQNGIRIDYYFHDCINDTEEIYLSLKERKLYNRGGVIDLDKIDKIPQRVNQHLTFNPITNKWVSSIPVSRNASWGRDEFADSIPEWRQRYGADFIEYRNVNGVLKQV